MSHLKHFTHKGLLCGVPIYFAQSGDDICISYRRWVFLPFVALAFFLARLYHAITGRAPNLPIILTGELKPGAVEID